MNIEPHVKLLQDKIAVLQKRIDWLEAHREKLAELPELSASGGLSDFDFDNLEHADVIRVVKAFGGKWKKKPSFQTDDEPRIDYVAQIDGMEVRCWQGKPPPNCRIVEVEEIVPAVVVAATTRKVKKLVCQNAAEPLAVAAAFAPKPEAAP